MSLHSPSNDHGLSQHFEQVVPELDLSLTTCHFCGKQPGESKCAVEVEIHGEVIRYRVTPTTYTEKWKQTKVRVPRCGACKERHEISERLEKIHTGIGCSLGVVVLVGIATYGITTGHNSEDSTHSVLLGGVLGFLVLGGYRALIDNWQDKSPAPEGLRPARQTFDFPPIRDLQAKGWQYGARPTMKSLPALAALNSENSAIPNYGKPLPAEPDSCPQCRTRHWWNGATCGLCDEPRDQAFPLHGTSLADLLKQFGQLNLMVQIPLEHAIKGGWRAEAAAILLRNGFNAEKTRTLVLDFESIMREKLEEG